VAGRCTLQAAQNIRFITIYAGTNVNGQESHLCSGVQTAQPCRPTHPNLITALVFGWLDNYNRCRQLRHLSHPPVASKVPNQLNCGWLGCHTDLTTERSRGVYRSEHIPLNWLGMRLKGSPAIFLPQGGEVILDPETRLPLPTCQASCRCGCI